MVSELAVAGAMVLVLILLSWAGIVWWYRDVIARAWAEPVLKRPVLIVESDDWGPGPPVHGERLGQIARALDGHRDSDGHPAVMTLGVLLAAPDGSAVGGAVPRTMPRLRLDDERCADVRQAMAAGCRTGVFAIQLHGLEHYWAPAVLAAARADRRVRDWLSGGEHPMTESLPASLQSRWVDGSTLPARALPAAEAVSAAAEEVEAFRSVFGEGPRVAVPPTFVWPREVEEAWLRAGVRVIVTPGWRYTTRDAKGRPAGAEGPLSNAARAGQDAIYVVRDIYFEPERGHRAEAAVTTARRRTALGRPALMETHRANFIGDEDTFRRSLAELEALLERARTALPRVRFMSTEALGEAYRTRDADLLDARMSVRVRVVLRRLAEHGRLRKLAWMSGLAVPAGLVAWLLREPGAATSGRRSAEGAT